jgi:hypothetical protein
MHRTHRNTLVLALVLLASASAAASAFEPPARGAASAGGDSPRSVVPATAYPDVLMNSGFETTGSWTTSASVLCTKGCSAEFAHAGTGFAWLDGYGKAHTDTLSQTTSVSYGHTVAKLQFWLHVDSAETSTTTQYDKLTVAIYDQAGTTLLKTLARFSNLNAGAGYRQYTYDMKDYIGKRITVKFTGTEDASQQTSFVLDDVELINY